MKQKIAIAFISILVTASICAWNLDAGTIKATGIHQGDLYKFLSATVTLVNSLKTNLNYNTTSQTTNVSNYNSVYANYSANNVLLSSAITKYNASYAIYSSNNVILGANVSKSQTAYARLSSLYTTLRVTPGTGYNNFSSKMAALTALGVAREATITTTYGGTQRATNVTSTIGGSKRMSVGSQATVSATSLSLTQ